MCSCLSVISSLMVPACSPGVPLENQTAHKVTPVCLCVLLRVGGEECMYIYNNPHHPLSTPCSPYCDRLRGGMVRESSLFILLWGEAGKAGMFFLIPNARIESMGRVHPGGSFSTTKKIPTICNCIFGACFVWITTFSWGKKNPKTFH